MTAAKAEQDLISNLQSRLKVISSLSVLYCLILSSNQHLSCNQLPPICSVCQIPLTVQHFMLDCPQFTVNRAKYFTVSSLKDLLYHVNDHVIVDFIKDIGFYDQL